MKSSTTGFSTLLNVSGNVAGTKELAQILGPKEFAFPKTTDLISTLIEQITESDSIVLDSFAGSGTTADAVLRVNKKDSGKRKFILVEIVRQIAESITVERLSRVSEGYDWQDAKGNIHHEKGLGGGFRYCELGPTLFDAAGTIRSEVSYEDLARHVFFTETGQPLSEDSQQPPPLLGAADGAAVYLLFNGVMQDVGNTLTPQILESLPPFDGPKVIYGDGCLVGGERLRQANAVFKQIPYEVRLR
jgi:site-specific DNA-methyltransferase (adenine-specific)/adenine-specific DNA-methyltransferase